MTNSRSLSGLLVLLLSSTSVAWAQPPAPPGPREYHVRLRYRIQAGRNERLVQYFDLLRFLKAAGFKKDPGAETDPEDFAHYRMTGTIAAANARKLLADPHIKALLLIPAGYQLPAEADQPVKVQIELASLPLPEQQQLLAQQVRVKLRQLGFREAAGYDHRGFRRLVGTIPAGELDTLLKDLRWQPAGWLAPAEGVATLPSPLRYLDPILVTEVVPEPAGVAAPKEAVAAEPARGLENISVDLRPLVTQEAEAAKPRRLEVILVRTPAEGDDSWRRPLAAAAPELLIEGRLGPLVTVVGPTGQALALAALPSVSAVRLPLSGEPQVRPAIGSKDGTQAALQASGLGRLHLLGHRGKGIRLAIIDGDFRGYEGLIGKRLPAGTRYLDLTAARNPDLLPEPFLGDPKVLGVGTQYALAAALAAPEAELILIRIDPAAPYQLQAVARAINGSPARSESLALRREELATEDRVLRKARADLALERNVILNLFGQDEETRKKRDDYFQKQAEYDRAEKAYSDRLQRFFRLQGLLRDLRGVRVVASSLVWNQGHPVDGSSPMSRYLDDNPFRAAFWFQSAGDTRGQAWAGPFRDADRNGVMEWAAPPPRPRPGRWTDELNFLGWQPFKGKPAAALPANTPLRLTLQWREPHDPEFWQRGEDLYRRPLAQLRLVLLRQRDPSGTQLPGDEMEVVAQSVGPPLRIHNLANSATYEQTLDYTVETPGRYALRIEGVVPAGIRPPGVPNVGVQKTWELRARVFVDVRESPARAAGRVVLLDYSTDQGGIGMPGDASSVITVGAADRAGRPQPYSGTGPAFDLALALKPNALAFDDLRVAPEGGESAQGASLATSFAAGMTATALGAGMPPAHLTRVLQFKPGGLLQVEGWSPGR